MDRTRRQAGPARGRHIVFLGYAVGVGKTYAMLREGRRRRRHGEDVVIGFLEPHGRGRITRLAAPLESLPPLHMEYRGATFRELDVALAVSRRPDWLLVDELAHTIVPGARHEKRWQAVEEVLDSGTGVMTTVNVQHVESLNQAVFKVTGVRVRETVPDRVLDEADEIVVVDMPPEKLLARLERGEVYGTDEIGPALTHFFKRTSLEALRRMAREVAERHRSRAGGT